MFGLDVESETFGKDILTGTYTLFLFVVLTVYRLDWIGRQKHFWLSTLLTLSCVVMLSIMLLYPKNIMALWKPTLAAFTIQAGYIFWSKLSRKNWSLIVARGFIALTCGFLIVPLFSKTGNPDYYSITGYLLLASLVFGVINSLLPENR